MVTAECGKMKQRILLISPFSEGLEEPNSYLPLGILYLASNMDPELWSPDLLVMQSREFDKFDYQYYGISSHSVADYAEVQRLIELISSRNKCATIFVGGSGASIVKRKVFNKTVIPYHGEGEHFFGGVDVSNLDNINFPARYLLPEHLVKYEGNVHHTGEKSTTIIATRGCTFSCNFCDRITHGRKFRKRSVANVSAEIQEVQNVYDIHWFRFVDDCITLDKKWFAELCLELGNLGIKWTCLSRSDTIDERLLKLMKSSGCQEIFFGFESGSQKMLDAMNKRTTVAKNAKAIEMCRDVGIKSCAYMMFGFPGEDEGTVDETIKFLDEVKPDKSRISTFLPIPGTDVWEDPLKYKVVIKDNYKDYWYFDSKDFALNYNYISNTEMEQLRNKIMSYYDKNYKKGWVKTC